MASGHVESVRRSLEAFNDRAAERLLAVCDPDCEMVPFRAQLEGTSYRGHEAIRRFLRDVEEDWAGFRITLLQFGEGGERVVVTGRVSGTGRASGVAVDFVAGVVFDFRGDLIAKVRSYSDPDAAVAASGLDLQATEEAR